MNNTIYSKFIFLLVSIQIVFSSLLFAVEIEKSTERRIINGKEYYIHIVEAGHTLYSLARTYDLPIDEIVFENPEAKDVIHVGQELRIPVQSREIEVEATLAKDASEFFYHVVKSGETLYSISKVYKTRVSDIRNANPSLRDPLRVGQYIKVPVSATKVEQQTKPKETFSSLQKKEPTPQTNSQKERLQQNQQKTSTSTVDKKVSGKNVYVVKAGDNLYRIALNHQRSIEELKNVNPGLTKELRIGQQIVIPKEKKKADQFFMHKIGRRTKLNKLANQFNVDINHLRELNPGIKDKLKSGQVVKIPLAWEPEADKPEVKEEKPQEEIITKPQPEVKEEIAFVEDTKVEEFFIDTITTIKPLNQDSLQCWTYAHNFEDTLKVALMVPLYLDQVDSLQFDENTNAETFLKQTPFRFIQFYYGVKMAVDSLNNLGYKVKLSVFDVDNSTAKTIKVLQEPSLQHQDLIIGPLFIKSFKLAANFAKIFKIPIVNPLTNRNQILEGNPYVVKCQPTDEYNHELIRDLVATYFTDAKIFFAKHHKQLTERDYPKYVAEIEPLIDSGYYMQNEDIFDLIIEKSLADTSTLYASPVEFLLMPDSLYHDSLMIVEDNLLPMIAIEGTQILTDSIEFNLYDSTFITNSIVPFYYSRDSIYAFENNASIYRENVVFTFTEDNVFALDLMTKMNIVRDTFPTTIVGLPKWLEFENMDYEILSNLNVHLVESDFVDYTNAQTKDFVYNYRKKFLTEPEAFAFNGFDFSWYFMKAILSFGKDFSKCLPYFAPGYVQTEMKFDEPQPLHGLENKNYKILKYHRFRLREVPVFPPEPVLNEEDENI